MRVRLSLRAARDFNRTVDRYIREAPSQAPRFSAEIEELLTRLRDYPAIAPEPDLRTLHRAVLSAFPYVVFYTIGDESVVVHHIRHASRRPWGG